MNQQRSGERAAVHSPCDQVTPLARYSGLPGVYALFLGVLFTKKRATSESREVYAPFLGVLRRVAYPFFVALLGCVKWRFKKTTVINTKYSFRKNS